MPRSPLAKTCNTLNVYNLMQHPLRSTARDHLYSFRRHGRGRQFYLNLGVRSVPRWMTRTRFDAVVYHTTFFSQRWTSWMFEEQFEKAAPLKGVGRVRVALPQDEFLHTDLLNRFINEFDIDEVFTLAAESELPTIYSDVDHERVRFHTALPGYLSDETARRIEEIVKRQGARRPIDIGYRAWKGAPWLGRHGMLKREVGERFAEAAPRHGLVTDISSEDSDVLNGDDWFRFLASCKYTLGVEGGASMLHRDGSLIERTDAYAAEHPDADFDEIERAVFPGEDGKVAYFAIGPRHIEACATRTCQILIEGDYQGVLRAGEHYIPLRKDFSNLDAVLEEAKADRVRERITEAAHRDVIASGSYSYEALVRGVEAVTAPPGAEPAIPARSATSLALAIREPLQRLADRVSWARVVYRVRVAPRLHRVSPYFPQRSIPAAWRRLRRSFGA